MVLKQCPLASVAVPRFPLAFSQGMGTVVVGGILKKAETGTLAAAN
jgi:hypothetical protein